MKKISLIILLWVFFANYSFGQTITAAEYFFDSDPGVGLATSLPITPGATITESFSIPTTGLSEGLHVLHIRTEDSAGNWSLYMRRYFYVSEPNGYNPPPVYDIVAAEYFFDNDTGVGNAGLGNIGGPLPVTQGLSISDTFSIPTTGLTDGLHVLHIRTQDTNGTWSLYMRRYFFLTEPNGYNPPPEYEIVAAEYFFDNDTGVGNAGIGNIGGSLPVTQGLSINETFSIPITGLTEGLHVLHIRTQDTNGTWSLYMRRYFFISEPNGYNPPPEYDIVELEYFFNTDPGVGMATTIDVPDGTSINESFIIPTSGLSEGLNVLHIRA
ncbi:MAG: hypothetical protein HKN54_03200, partial [Flavobacteriaceae bacterium]|nr:hypothetical protein [Flavobacteriaceae bacterium]